MSNGGRIGKGKGRGFNGEWLVAYFVRQGHAFLFLSKVHSLCAIELKGKKQAGHKISFPPRNSDIKLFLYCVIWGKGLGLLHV